MQCPKCGNAARKDGKVRNQQRYECGNPSCNHHFVAYPLPVGAPKKADTPFCDQCHIGKLHKRHKRNGWQYFQCSECRTYSRIELIED